MAALEGQVAVQEHNVATAASSHQTASEAVAEQRLRIHTSAQKREQLAEQQRALETESQNAMEQFQAVTRLLSTSRERLNQCRRTFRMPKPACRTIRGESKNWTSPGSSGIATHLPPKSN